MAKPGRKTERKQRQVCLVCWNEALAAARASDLRRDGFRVTVVDREMGGWVSYFRELAVDAVVIDLDRLPSHGREVGMVLRASKATRHLRVVYLGGVAEKVDRLRCDVPEATFAEWNEAAGAIRSAMDAAIDDPIDKAIDKAGFAMGVARAMPVRPVVKRDDDLARRLGIAAGTQIVTWGEQEFLLELLPPLLQPLQKTAGVWASGVPGRRKTLPGDEVRARLWLCVVRTLAEAHAAFAALVADGSAGHAGERVSGWMVHPKMTSRYHSDFNQNDVREVGLARGWVDCKVCAIDQDWSGLKFMQRRPGQALKANMLKGPPAK